MSVVLCLPAHLRVSTAASRGQAPHGNASLLYAYQGLKGTTKGEESVEDCLPTSITQRASNLHSYEDMEEKIKLLDPRVQTLIRT